MTIKIKMWREETRPNVDVPFWDRSLVDEDYYTETYKTTGLLESESLTVSEDGLTRLRVHWWNAIPGLIETLAEDLNLKDILRKNKEYNESLGIEKGLLYFITYDSDGINISEGTFPGVE
jgi:hypothetical protein